MSEEITKQSLKEFEAKVVVDCGKEVNDVLEKYGCMLEPTVLLKNSEMPRVAIAIALKR